MHILVTGASGFVGGRLVSVLASKANVEVSAVARRDDFDRPETVNLHHIHELSSSVDWTNMLAGVDVVVHAAARVHVMDDSVSNPIAEFRKTNVEGTLHLARQSVVAGVRRFIFISSIKVNGEGTMRGVAYNADDAPAPADPYGVSKMEAEIGLLKLANESNLEVVIIRPVLVYGPGVKANFLTMMSWLDKKTPLPLASINNKRSLVALDNLVGLIITCLDHPAAVNQIFLVSDGEDLSTTELLRRMAAALGKPAYLIPFPRWILQSCATLLGKKAVVHRLCGSLQVDISKTRSLLDWTPTVSVDSALKSTALHFLGRQQ